MKNISPGYKIEPDKAEAFPQANSHQVHWKTDKVKSIRLDAKKCFTQTPDCS